MKIYAICLGNKILSERQLYKKALGCFPALANKSYLASKRRANKSCLVSERRDDLELRYFSCTGLMWRNRCRAIEILELTPKKGK